MDAIHLILDNCRPDDRNPCILAFESPRVSPEPRERGPGRAGPPSRVRSLCRGRALLPARGSRAPFSLGCGPACHSANRSVVS